MIGGRAVRPGEPWGEPSGGPPDLVVEGDDANLAAALGDRLVEGGSAGNSRSRGPLVQFSPSPRSDIARALGIRPGGLIERRTLAVPMDTLLIEGLSSGRTNVVNGVVIGPAPRQLRWWHHGHVMRVTVDGRSMFEGAGATTLVIMTGEFVSGWDVAPRGHPGDARMEVQVYALNARERSGMRARLGTGSHVPHPRIFQRSGKTAEVELDHRMRVAVDGTSVGSVDRLTVSIVSGAYRLWI